MRDSRGRIWFVSFDANGHPQAATGAIMVANKIFWALGYWQVENFLVTVAPNRPSSPRAPRSRRSRAASVAWSSATSTMSSSERIVALTVAIARWPRAGYPDVCSADSMLRHASRRPERRRTTSTAVSCAALVFGAWTNLVDMKAGNTLDTVIEENGRSVVRHYLQDVGSTFGTGANGPRI